MARGLVRGAAERRGGGGGAPRPGVCVCVCVRARTHPGRGPSEDRTAATRAGPAKNRRLFSWARTRPCPRTRMSHPVKGRGHPDTTCVMNGAGLDRPHRPPRRDRVPSGHSSVEPRTVDHSIPGSSALRVPDRLQPVWRRRVCGLIRPFSVYRFILGTDASVSGHGQGRARRPTITPPPPLPDTRACPARGRTCSQPRSRDPAVLGEVLVGEVV